MGGNTRGVTVIAKNTARGFATIVAQCGYKWSNTREMQSINGASLRVLDSSIERIVLKTFESRN